MFAIRNELNQVSDCAPTQKVKQTLYKGRCTAVCGEEPVIAVPVRFTFVTMTRFIFTT